MKACVLHAIGDLRFEDVAQPLPKRGEVLLRVGACGVCGSDVPRVFSKGTYHFPTIPGHEFAGEVEAVGDGVDSGLVGRRAAVFPLIPCRQCAACEIGAYAQCENYDYLGSRSNGAFADYVCAPAWNLVLLPDNVSYAEAAMLEPAAVAAHALRQEYPDPDDTGLIFGAGPIGLLVALWARAQGTAKIVLADIDGAKLAFARNQGFDLVVNPNEEDVAARVRELAGRGADFVVEASGSPAAFGAAMACARTFGSVVLLGNPAGEMKLSQADYWAILRKELNVVGSWNSRYSSLADNEWQLALDAMAAGTLNVKPLISHTVGLEQLPEALAMMRDRTEFYSKVMYVADWATREVGT